MSQDKLGHTSIILQKVAVSAAETQLSSLPVLAEVTGKGVARLLFVAVVQQTGFYYLSRSKDTQLDIFHADLGVFVLSYNLRGYS